MEIHVDNRELKLIPLIKNSLSETNIEFKCINLQLGDILLVKNEEPLILFERKTISDLCSSILDGRYKEQSLRLNSYNIPNHNIYYIIEGSLDKISSYSKFNKNTLLSSILSLNYFKGFSVLRSLNVNETSDIITQFAKKLNKTNDLGYYCKPEIEKEKTEDTDYLSVIKMEKNKNITKDNINTILLCQIPNVSLVSANAIIEKYESFYNLIKCLKENENILDDITYDCKGKQRKISKKVINNIKTFLCN